MAPRPCAADHDLRLGCAAHHPSPQTARRPPTDRHSRPTAHWRLAPLLETHDFPSGNHAIPANGREVLSADARVQARDSEHRARRSCLAAGAPSVMKRRAPPGNSRPLGGHTRCRPRINCQSGTCTGGSSHGEVRTDGTGKESPRPPVAPGTRFRQSRCGPARAGHPPTFGLISNRMRGGGRTRRGVTCNCAPRIRHRKPRLRHQ